ncbi:hypothetical protein SLS53_004426 [Cytospora paraplurivora]|uniref:Uncharacterized protein n=1 Tax=Cytospora paraplurivora TaxID=2898453 RepID=A0AAN9YH68_9PEZI
MTKRKEAYPNGELPSETTNHCEQYNYQLRIGQQETPHPQIVRIRLRGHRLFLLLANTTNPESLRKEAVHFDKEISYWERLGYFETLTSSRGRFVVQYDKTDIGEMGIPKAVIGTSEEIIAFGLEEDEDDRERMQDIDETEGEKEKFAMCKEPVTKLRASQPAQKRSLEASPQPAGPTAKKLQTSTDHLPGIASMTPTPTMANMTKVRTRMCSPSHVTDYRDPEDSDNDTDIDEDDDEPPDWTEYENLDITAGKKKFANGSEVGMLDTRVDFVQIDLVPPEVYEAACESDEGPPEFCDYLVRGQPLPELGDLTPIDIIRGWRKEDSEAMTAKWKGGSIRHDGKGFSAV